MRPNVTLLIEEARPSVQATLARSFNFGDVRSTQAGDDLIGQPLIMLRPAALRGMIEDRLATELRASKLGVDANSLVEHQIAPGRLNALKDLLVDRHIATIDAREHHTKNLDTVVQSVPNYEH